MAPVAARLPPNVEQGDTSSLAVTEATIREARAALERAVIKAGLTNDPVGYLLEATSGALGAFLVGIEAVRSPLDQELREALLLEVGKGTRAGANDAMRVEAARTHRIFNRDFAVRVGLGVAGAFLLGVALTYGVLRATQLGPFDRDVQAAAAWHDIEQRNPDPRQNLGAAEVRTDKVSGRPYYAGVSLWLDPLGPPPGTGSRP